MPAPRAPYAYATRAVRALAAAALLAALVVALPWGLVHFVGWPLPGDVPTGGDIETVLTTPMSTTFLIDTLACILWPAWALFVLDVAWAAAREIRGLPTPTLPRARPLHSLAAALVGTVVVSLLVLRPAAPAGAAPAPARPAATAPEAAGSPPTTGPDRQTPAGSVEVRAPRDGIYDSLWRIADRTLGDGNRWPEIYALNHGRPQADGRTLTHPDLIRPGWVLRLPGSPARTVSPPLPRPPRHATPAPARPSPTPRPTPSTAPASPSPSTHAPASPTGRSPARGTHGEHGQPGISLPEGAFVGAGLATVVAVALVVVRRRRRIRYRPGSGDRDDLAIAPVVRALRIAHDDTASEDDPPAGDVPPLPAQLTAARVVGVRDGQAIAWDVARTRGLGLIGPGDLDAARALLIACLTDQTAQVVVPLPDAELLLGGATTGYPQPAGVRIVDDLDTALDALESELLSRARASIDATGDETSAHPHLVLIATPAEPTNRRLQAVLDNGSSVGLAGILLGQWRPGGTLRIRIDGTVAAASPELARDLAGARLFHLPAADAEALLALLARAAPAPTPVLPAADPPPPQTPASPGSSQSVDGFLHAEPGSFSGARLADPASEEGTAGQVPRAVLTADAEPPAPPVLPLELTVLGRIRLTHHLPDGTTHTDLTASLAPKHREVLTYLALHPRGARREAIAAAIWPDAPRSRPYNSFHATLSQLRRALRTATHDEQADIALHMDGHYAIDPRHTTVDLWALQDALRSTGRDHPDVHSAVQKALALYAGDLAPELTTEWIEAPRESLRRDVLDAVSTLIREVRPSDPHQALRLLERTRALDPYNEAVYRAIAQLQSRTGHIDAVPRTWHLLTTVLADIDEHPSPETVKLFAELQHPLRTAD
jgi:DNA-binding SARP family transcriptional activator